MDCAARNVSRRGILDGGERGGAVKADKPETCSNLFDALDRLFWRGPMGGGNPSQRRGDFGQTVAGATGGLRFASGE